MEIVVLTLSPIAIFVVQTPTIRERHLNVRIAGNI
jgi:hypothetical protein